MLPKILGIVALPFVHSLRAIVARSHSVMVQDSRTQDHIKCCCLFAAYEAQLWWDACALQIPR